MPKITVVIPLFNKEKYIERALVSVLNQTFQDYEIILVDDGSTDSSVVEAKKIRDPRIRLILQQNLGASVARNVGVMHSNSDIIAFLDADDEWISSYLSFMCALIEKYPEAGAFILDYDRIIAPKKKKRKDKKITDGIISNYFKKCLKGRVPITSSSIAIRKEIFCKLNGFKKGAYWGEDQDLWARLALNSHIAFSTFKGTMIHDTSDPISQIKKRTEITSEHPLLVSYPLLINDGKISEDIRNDFFEYLAKLRISSAFQNLLCGDQKGARIQLKNCKTRLFLLNKLWCLFWTMVPIVILNMLSGMIFITGEMAIECILGQRDIQETSQIFLNYWIYRKSKPNI
jgi:glycosyltransferase involved in cell wall biosynthesis